MNDILAIPNIKASTTKDHGKTKLTSDNSGSTIFCQSHFVASVISN